MGDPFQGVVACGHPEVCAAAVEVLRAGGNAADAVVAAGFASALCEPALTSLGGGGFLLSRTAEGRTCLFDFFSDTPGRELPARELEPHFLPVTVRFPGQDQVFNVGLGSVAVPGNLRGLLHVHERLGRLPLAEVLAPAVSLGRDGVMVNASQAYFLELLRPIFTLRDEGRALFAPAGDLPCEGERLRNPELASFLETLPSDGDRELYEGELARRIAADMHEGQGLLTMADLAGYRVIEREPLHVRWRSHELLTNPPPSLGGVLLALSLHLLETAPPAARIDGPDHAIALLEAMRETHELRERGESGARLRRFQRGTTHVSVCDAAGNSASMTTSNGEGSGYFVPGAGIQLNNMMGEDDLHPDGFHASPPGERVASMMSPSLLLLGGKPQLVLGSGGSKRIRTALLQVVSAVADCGLPVEEAVPHPRMHWDGQALQVEPGFPEPTLAALARRAPINVWDRLDVYFGGVHAVTPTGGGAGDPRRGGVVARA